MAIMHTGKTRYDRDRDLSWVYRLVLPCDSSRQWRLYRSAFSSNQRLWAVHTWLYNIFLSSALLRRHAEVPFKMQTARVRYYRGSKQAKAQAWFFRSH